MAETEFRVEVSIQNMKQYLLYTFNMLYFLREYKRTSNSLETFGWPGLEDRARAFRDQKIRCCLFFCHLSLEKLLKGLVVIHTKQQAPFIHDLERLSVIANLSLASDQIDALKAISDFNIAGHYSDYKFAFYKKCTRPYTKNYLTKTKSLIACLRKKYPNR